MKTSGHDKTQGSSRLVDLSRKMSIICSSLTTTDQSLVKEKRKSFPHSPCRAKRQRPEQDKVRQMTKQVSPMEVLIDITHQMFPHLHERTYLLPPVHFNRVSYSEIALGSDFIKVCQPHERMSDVRFDECRRRIHNVMTSLCERLTEEAMAVCFSLVFDNYLNCGGKSGPHRKKKKAVRCDDWLGRERGEKSPPLGSVTLLTSRPWQQNGDLSNDDTHALRQPNRQEMTLREDASSSEPCLSDLDLSVFPRPRDIQKRGEIDVLIMHPHRGLIVAEIKSLGDTFDLPELRLGLLEQQRMIRRITGKSVCQLDRQAEMVRYLVNDVQTDIPVTKVLILPNLNRKVLHAAVLPDLELVETFCQTFESTSLDQALQKCIFSEQLPPIGHSLSTDDDLISHLLHDWWRPLTETVTHSCLDKRVYEEIVARFCGPATKQSVCTAQRPHADVSTMAQAVQETSRCFTAPVLTPQQVSLLKEQCPRVMVCGPPGTGKTLMLKLKVKEWLQQGHTVLVISLRTSSHAVACSLDHQVREEVTPKQAGRFHLKLNLKPNLMDIARTLQTFRRNSREMCAASGLPETSVPDIPSLDSGFGDYTGEDSEDSCESDSGKAETQHDQADTDSKGVPHNGETDNDVDLLDCIYIGNRRGSQLCELHAGHGSCSNREGILDQHSSSHHQKLHVVVPEAPWFLDKLLMVLEAVLGKDQFLIWVSTSSPCPHPPSFAYFEVRHNLRRPPAVVREMMTTPAHHAFVRPTYTSQDAGVLSSMPYPTDGPPVKRIRHEGHGEKEVWNCERCGEALALFLTQELGIGKEKPGATYPAAPELNQRLLFSDILLSGHLPDIGELGRSSRKSGTTPNTTGPEPTARGLSSWAGPLAWVPGLLTGLERGGVPYDVIDNNDDNSYRKLAVPANADGVQVVGAELVKGLERKVVVVVGMRDFSEAVPHYVDPSYDVMGCCTSQLVLVGGENAERSFVARLMDLKMD